MADHVHTSGLEGLIEAAEDKLKQYRALHQERIAEAEAAHGDEAPAE